MRTLANIGPFEPDHELNFVWTRALTTRCERSNAAFAMTMGGESVTGFRISRANLNRAQRPLASIGPFEPDHELNFVWTRALTTRCDRLTADVFR